jgi:nicotinate-nucleotide adenylyltransferase
VSAPIGLLGGTFDPLHNAHLRLGVEALEALELDSVRWLPIGRPGHRDVPHASAEDRLAMLRLALAHDKRFTIDEADLHSPQPSYTVNTLARLRRELGGTVPLALIIGADHLLALERWREWRRLFELAHLAVAQRPGHPITAQAMAPEVATEYMSRTAAACELAARPAGLVTVFQMTPLDISATAIRNAVAEGRRTRHLLPDAVLDYITARGLYRT